MSDTSGTPPQDEPNPRTTGGTPAWASGASGAGTGAPAFPPADPAENPASPPSGRRPAWLIPVAVGVGVVVVAGIVIAAVTAGGDDDAAAPTPIPTPTVVLPSPTPTVAPAQRPSPTDFTSALPATILQYAFTTEKPAPALLQAGALEAVTDTYSDGGSGTLTVDAAQFTTATAAADAAKQVAGATKVEPTSPAAGLPQQGDVMAAGKKVGTYAIVDAGSGQGTAIWTNGTALFRLTAPVADVVDAYNAYPM